MRRTVWSWLAVVSPVLLVVGCTTSGDAARARRAAESLDRVAERIEEYGSITMSSPLLSLPDPGFAFDLDRETSQYFEDARTRVEGSAAAFEQIYQALTVRGSAQFDPVAAAAFADALTRYRGEQARIDRRTALLDSAAEMEFSAAMNEAMKIEDETARQKAIADARRRMAEQISVPETPSSFPSLPAVGAAPGQGEASGGAAGSRLEPPVTAAQALRPQFADHQALLKGGDPALSNRAALLTAAGDKAVEAIFRVLGNPGEAQRFRDKVVLFGVATVSVDPGWRTREGFAADLSVRTRLRWSPARREVAAMVARDGSIPAVLRASLVDEFGLPDGPANLAVLPVSAATSIPEWLRCERRAACNGAKPLVAAVAPLSETQSLDLASSYRRMDELAILLAGSLRQQGLDTQAEVYEQFVRSRQRDVRTRSAAGVTNSFSAGGGIFGYQVGPRLRALADETDDEAEAGRLLDRQSFPVLIVFGFDAADIRPLFLRTDRDELELYEPYLELVQTARWVPIEKHWWQIGGLFRHRLSETERVAMSRELSAEATDCHLDVPDSVVPAGTRSAFHERCYALKHMIFGSTTYQALPVDVLLPNQSPSLPVVRVISPESITLPTRDGTPQKTRVELVILGEHLHSLALHGIDISAGDAEVVGGEHKPRRVGDALVVTVDVKSASSPIVLELPLEGTAASFLGGSRRSIPSRTVKVTVAKN